MNFLFTFPDAHSSLNKVLFAEKGVQSWEVLGDEYPRLSKIGVIL
jgi:hypothetical protein